MELSWLLNFSPDIVDVLDDLSAGLSLIVVLLIEIPDTEKNGFG